MTYENGDLCHTNNVKRKTTVVALCEDALEATEGADQVREVGGAKMCDYEIIFRSSYACPKECPVAGDERKSCGGNGHCRTTRTPRRRAASAAMVGAAWTA